MRVVFDGTPYHEGCVRRDPLPWGAVVDGTHYHGGFGRGDSLPWELWSRGLLTMGAVVDGTPYHGRRILALYSRGPLNSQDHDMCCPVGGGKCT